MEDNIRRLNSILIFEHSFTLLRKESDDAYYRLKEKLKTDEDSISIDWADKLFIKDSDEIKLAQTFPHIVLLGLCIEMGIKALAFQKGKTIEDGHNIKHLLDKLEPSIKERIKKNTMHSLKMNEDSFNATLKDNSRVFTDVRYLYELKANENSYLFLDILFKAIKYEIDWDYLD